MDPIRTIIVDDEPPARQRLQSLLRDRPDIEVLGVGRDGSEAVALVQQHRPQLLFLDVQMPVLDGFSALKLLAPESVPLTIFVTAYDQYAMAAFEAHALDYLLKPFSDERFESALERAIHAIRTAAVGERREQLEGVLAEQSAVDARSGFLDRIAVRKHGRVELLNVADIDWIGAAGVYVELHTAETTHVYRSSLQALLQRLDTSRFVRIHRSTVVNTDRIKELRPRGHSDFTVVLRDGRLVPLSRAYRSALEAWLGQAL
jgi:two-component system, LytTR family, response regulator